MNSSHEVTVGLIDCRYDKERQQFAIEIETVTTMLESANKGKVSYSYCSTIFTQMLYICCVFDSVCSDYSGWLSTRRA